jgi:hypothetical protein
MSSRTTEWYLKSHESVVTARGSEVSWGRQLAKLLVKVKKLMSKDYGADKFPK